MSDPTDASGTGPAGPWWASGSDPDEGLDDRDPLGAHRRARRGEQAGDDPAGGGPDGDADEADRNELGALAVEAVDLLARFTTETARRVGRDRGGPDGPSEDAATDGHHGGPHGDGSVCDACPVCIALRAVQASRPEVVAHLSDAAHHVTAALQAFADAQAATDEGLQHIDLDP